MLSKQSSNDFFMEALKGNINDVSAVRLLGRNPDNDAATEDVWIGSDVNFGDGYDTARTLRSTAAAVYVSSSANHATDRAKSVTITGVDGNYDTVSETIHLNSTNSQTRVSSVGTYLRINSATLDGACTGTVFVSTSACTAGVPNEKAKVDAVIAIGKLFAEQALYTVPRDKTGYINNIYIEATTSAVLSATLSIITDSVTTSYVVGRFASPGVSDKPFTTPIIVPATSDVVLKVTSDSGNVVVNAIVDMILEDITIAVSTVDLVNFGSWQTYMSGKTITSANLYLLGLDAAPTTIPTTAPWAVVAGPIAGQTADNDQLNPVYDTNISFELSQFKGGAHDILADASDYAAVLSIWKVVDSSTATKYVIGPVNSVINVRNTKVAKYVKLA